MKNKLNIRGRLLGAVAIVAASFIGATPITAFAGGPDCTCEHKCTADKIDPDCELCKYDYTMCEGKDPEETEPEEPAEPEEEETEEPVEEEPVLETEAEEDGTRPFTL